MIADANYEERKLCKLSGNFGQTSFPIWIEQRDISGRLSSASAPASTSSASLTTRIGQAKKQQHVRYPNSRWLMR